ncbi:GrpE domain-containing protein [Cephalotus follicularis]|uniref:GrpE protein homolog n=1 Tax=Cephalotus follicularis TaxID=3775 RepID=A0A1Q3AU83_CEPFO|nr:GrpE domain-containing protein [Cephalotus follicularis]
MAVCLPNLSLLPPVLSASFSSSKSKTSKTLPIQSLQLKQPILLLPSPLPTFSSPINNNNSRTPFKSHVASQHSIPTNGDVKPSESGAPDEKDLASLKTLINVYKEAILDGDEKTVSDIEARISIIEIEKNELVQKVSALSADITSGKEKYIRLQADFDNFRKRSEKERVTVRMNAQGEVMESLLPMVDSFEKAKQQIKPQTEKEKKIDTSYQGIYKQFVEIMRSLQVAAVPTVGKPFDPSMHEAIAREECQELKEGIIVQELRRGFLLGGRLLRPAMVKVSAGPGSKKAHVAKNESTGKPATAAGVDER